MLFSNILRIFVYLIESSILFGNTLSLKIPTDTLLLIFNTRASMQALIILYLLSGFFAKWCYIQASYKDEKSTQNISSFYL